MIHLPQLAECTRRLIVAAGLSVSEVSEFTRVKYGVNSAYFISDKFLSAIKQGVSPHLCQIVALSEATSCSFADLMQHFGFDLGQLTRLQMKLHRDRTVLIAPSESFSLGSSNRGQYLYAQIGREDGMGFPEVVPGSIVRIDTRHPIVSEPAKTDGNRLLCVVDHLRGLNCCYVTTINRHEILLTPHHLAYPCLQYRLDVHARILGVVDAELRPLLDIDLPDFTMATQFERRVPLPTLHDRPRLSQLIRSSRERVGFHFRQARDMSARIAEELGNKHCAIALGTLSDYEAADAIPRHISKIISLCVLYAIDFERFLAAAGITMRGSARDAQPNNGTPGLDACSSSDIEKKTRDTSDLTRFRFPLSLVDARTDLLRNKFVHLQTHSVRTRLNVSQSQETLLVVNRSVTRPQEGAWPAAWQRPVYLVKKRNGEYACGFCTVNDGSMTVHNPPTLNTSVETFYSEEAAIVGQVVIMLRSVGSSCA